MTNYIQTLSVLDLSETIATELFSKFKYPWEVLPHIENFIIEIAQALSSERYEQSEPNVWIAKSAKVSTNACITSTCIIGENTEIRQSAFIRGSVIVGDNCVVGNSSELKNCILFNEVQVPHYNYIGDSVLGYKSHMGAGAITSNVKNDKTLVTIKYHRHVVETKLKKFGAIIGDFSQIGCNSVLNPGTIVGRKTNIYPLSNVRGYVPDNSIYKSSEVIVDML